MHVGGDPGTFEQSRALGNEVVLALQAFGQLPPGLRELVLLAHVASDQPGRTQEIGLLRAIGLDRSGVRLMVRLESVVISLFGGLLGVGLGVLLGWAVGELVAHLLIDTWTTVLPWGRLVLFLAAAALVGVLAAIWPARWAARLNLLDAIRTE